MAKTMEQWDFASMNSKEFREDSKEFLEWVSKTPRKATNIQELRTELTKARETQKKR